MPVMFLQQELALFEDEERVNRQVSIAILLVWKDRFCISVAVMRCIVHYQLNKCACLLVKLIMFGRWFYNQSL
jgi:hypothetical protein